MDDYTYTFYMTGAPGLSTLVDWSNNNVLIWLLETLIQKVFE